MEDYEGNEETARTDADSDSMPNPPDTRLSFKKTVPFYAGMLFIVALIFVRQFERQEAVKLLLWELLAVFGYFAAAGDFRKRKIPNRLIRMMAGAWVLVMVPQLFLHTESALYEILDGGLGFLTCGLLMITIYLASRKGLGGGDVKFMTVSGLYLGFSDAFAALLYGSVFAALCGLVLIALKKLSPKDTIPLVPFLYAGIVLAIAIR